MVAFGLKKIAEVWLKAIPNEVTNVVGEPVMQLTIRSVDREMVYIFSSFIKKTINNAGGLTVDGASSIYELKRWTVLSSPFVHKKARTQFEKRINPRSLQIFNMDHNLCKTILWYIYRNSPPNIDMTAHIRV